MDETGPRQLVAVLANPPLADGKRTMRRVALAAEILGFGAVEIANLFAFPSQGTGAICEIGAREDGWIAARPTLEARVSAADGILLAYGTTSPAGPARVHFRNQIGWLLGLMATTGTGAWHVGDGPRHPSRWQRWTCRAHPDIPFTTALARSLVPTLIPQVGPLPASQCDVATVREHTRSESRAISEGRGKSCNIAS